MDKQINKCVDVFRSQVLTEEEETLNFWNGKGNKVPCDDELELEVLI